MKSLRAITSLMLIASFALSVFGQTPTVDYVSLETAMDQFLKKNLCSSGSTS